MSSAFYAELFNKMETKTERIARLKKDGLLKDRHSRKLEKYSDSFNEMFRFFLDSYRRGLLEFAGVSVEILYDQNGTSGKETFRKFEDGQFKNRDIKSVHPNIVSAVIIAKKSWGLHSRMWAEGVAEHVITKQEILDTFLDNKIKIPDVLLKGFDNEIMKRKIAIIDEYLENK